MQYFSYLKLFNIFCKFQNLQNLIFKRSFSLPKTFHELLCSSNILHIKHCFCPTFHLWMTCLHLQEWELQTQLFQDMLRFPGRNDKAEKYGSCLTSKKSQFLYRGRRRNCDKTGHQLKASCFCPDAKALALFFFKLAHGNLEFPHNFKFECHYMNTNSKNKEKKVHFWITYEWNTHWIL